MLKRFMVLFFYFLISESAWAVNVNQDPEAAIKIVIQGRLPKKSGVVVARKNLEKSKKQLIIVDLVALIEYEKKSKSAREARIASRTAQNPDAKKTKKKKKTDFYAFINNN